MREPWRKKLGRHAKGGVEKRGRVQEATRFGSQGRGDLEDS